MIIIYHGFLNSLYKDYWIKMFISSSSSSGRILGQYENNILYRFGKIPPKMYAYMDKNSGLSDDKIRNNNEIYFSLCKNGILYT